MGIGKVYRYLRIPMGIPMGRLEKTQGKELQQDDLGRLTGNLGSTYSKVVIFFYFFALRILDPPMEGWALNL